MRQCQNDNCPVKEHLRQWNGDRDDIPGVQNILQQHGFHRQELIDGEYVCCFPCPKCHGVPVKYCSQRCF